MSRKRATPAFPELVRACWIPRPARRATETRFGGRPPKAPGAWPSCAGCGESMQFVVHLAARDAALLHPVAPEIVQKEKALQLFSCLKCVPDDTDEETSRWVAVDAAAAASGEADAGSDAEFAPTYVSSWRKQDDWVDRFAPCVSKDQRKYMRDSGVDTLTATKIGGWAPVAASDKPLLALIMPGQEFRGVWGDEDPFALACFADNTFSWVSLQAWRAANASK